MEDPRKQRSLEAEEARIAVGFQGYIKNSWALGTFAFLSFFLH
jgi:hypothetical protein